MSTKKVLSLAFILGLCAIGYCGIDCFNMPQSGRATRNARTQVFTGTDVRIIQGTPSSIMQHRPTASDSSINSESDDDNGDDKPQKKQDSYTKIVVLCLSAIGLTCFFGVGSHFELHHLPTGTSSQSQVGCITEVFSFITVIAGYIPAFFNSITAVFNCITAVVNFLTAVVMVNTLWDAVVMVITLWDAMVKDSMSDKTDWDFMDWFRSKEEEPSKGPGSRSEEESGSSSNCS